MVGARVRQRSFPLFALGGGRPKSLAWEGRSITDNRRLIASPGVRNTLGKLIGPPILLRFFCLYVCLRWRLNMNNLLYNRKCSFHFKGLLLICLFAGFGAAKAPIATAEEGCSLYCPGPGTFNPKQQCTSAADICACESSVEAGKRELDSWEKHDCSHPMTRRIIKACEELRLQEVTKAQRVVQSRTALLAKCRQQVGRTSVGSPSNGEHSVLLSGNSFELKLEDAREGNIFYATLEFLSADQAQWRYRSRREGASSRIQGRGDVKLSGSTAMFNDGQGDWRLHFSPDYQHVRGTYSFWQERVGKPRTRHYEVIGVSSKNFHGWPGL